MISKRNLIVKKSENPILDNEYKLWQREKRKRNKGESKWIRSRKRRRYDILRRK